LNPEHGKKLRWQRTSCGRPLWGTIALRPNLWISTSIG
jgi:hypothetical protein